MKMRACLGAAALVVLFSPAVMAATTNASAGQTACSSLAKQFDTAAQAHASAAKIGDAKKLASDAAADCKAQRFAQGEKKYNDALADLGVKAQM
jgi:hypothetical protein